MMRSRHMLRPLGDRPHTRLLINSQAFVLTDSTGEITPGTFAFSDVRSTSNRWMYYTFCVLEVASFVKKGHRISMQRKKMKSRMI